MKTIIAGGRDFCDKDFLFGSLHSLEWEIDEVVSGTARGADRLGEEFASFYKKDMVQFPADWNTNGKAAGPIRNAEMAKYAEACVCFWDGKSKGTRHMIETAAKKGLYVKVFFYEGS